MLYIDNVVAPIMLMWIIATLHINYKEMVLPVINRITNSQKQARENLFLYSIYILLYFI